MHARFQARKPITIQRLFFIYQILNKNSHDLYREEKRACAVLEC